MEPFDIPVLFIVFNRHTEALETFSCIKKIKPAKLYIASDGARNSAEKEIVLKIRKEVLALIDWDCDLKTLFREKNLGCGPGVYDSINWFLSSEEMGIIIEDDLLTDNSFYVFMKEMLIRYKDDSRIGMISGYNLLGKGYTEFSYTFSKYKACTGWGTWKRAWENMDYKMQWLGDSVKESTLLNMGYMSKDISTWEYNIKCVRDGYISSWDFQWYFSLANQNQLSIFPNGNLVKNIGIGAAATHSKIVLDIYLQEINPPQFPLRHPKYMVPNYIFDKNFFKKTNSLSRRIINKVPFRVKKLLKKILLKN